MLFLRKYLTVMFKKNNQPDLFSFETQLLDNKQ